jgi:hypothetical protein
MYLQLKNTDLWDLFTLPTVNLAFKLSSSALWFYNWIYWIVVNFISNNGIINFYKKNLDFSHFHGKKPYKDSSFLFLIFLRTHKRAPFISFGESLKNNKHLSCLQNKYKFLLNFHLLYIMKYSLVKTKLICKWGQSH